MTEQVEFEQEKLNRDKEKLELDKEELKIHEKKKQKRGYIIFLILALICFFVALISLFMPWMHMQSRASVSSPYYSDSATLTGGSVSAIISPEGMLSFLLLIIAAYYLFKRKILSYLFPLAAIGLSLLFLSRMDNSLHSSMSGTGYSASANMEPDVGVAVFLLSAILLSLFAALYLHVKKRKVGIIIQKPKVASPVTVSFHEPSPDVIKEHSIPVLTKAEPLKAPY
jgi:hypothetical protein